MQEQSEPVSIRFNPHMSCEAHTDAIRQILTLRDVGESTPHERATMRMLTGMYQVMLDIRDRLPPLAEDREDAG